MTGYTVHIFITILGWLIALALFVRNVELDIKSDKVQKQTELSDYSYMLLIDLQTASMNARNDVEFIGVLEVLAIAAVERLEQVGRSVPHHDDALEHIRRIEKRLKRMNELGDEIAAGLEVSDG